MKIKTIGFIQTDYGHAAVQTAAYQSGGALAVMLSNSTTEEAISTLSVNLPDADYELAPGEFFAKTWSENEDIAKLALASGLFEDTGRRVPTGWVEAQVWKIITPSEKSAKYADLVQSACSPSGVTHSLIKLMEGGLGPSAPVTVMFASKIGDMARQSDNTPTRHTTWEDVLQLAKNAVKEMSDEIGKGTDTDGLRNLPLFQIFAKELRAWTGCDNYKVLSCAQDRVNEAISVTT
jgi:hypothetical protein